MAAAQRPYFSSSIDDLEAVFAAHSQDLRVLSELVQELSLRKTNRARRLLALAAKRLADHDPDADGSVEQGVSDEDLPLPEEDLDLLGNEKLEGATRNHTKNAPVSRPSTYDTAASDQPPDDRKRPERLSRIRPVGTPGLPEPWVPPLHADRPLGVAANADLPQIYAAALAALIAEIKSTGAGQKRYELENGIRVEGKEAVYEFPFTDEADLFEDANVEVEISGRRINASIVSISSDRLFLATDEDLGRVLERVILLVDATALLEALKQRIEEAYKGEISLCLLKTPKDRERLEIFASPPYPCRHDHNSFRPRFPALVPCSQPRLTGA